MEIETMNTLIVEIGNHSIRAAMHNGLDTKLLPIGAKAYPYKMSSVCVKPDNGKYVWGEMADYWMMNNSNCLYYPLNQLEKQSAEYEVAITDLIAQILANNAEMDSIIYIIPPYWQATEPKRNALTNAAKSNNLNNISFISTPVAVCKKVAYLSDHEYALFYDAGYKGISISLLQRNSNEIVVLDSAFLEDVGGAKYDTMISNTINDNMSGKIEDIGYKMLYAYYLREKVVFIKERLSFEEECHVPVENGDRVFELTSSQWQDQVIPSLSSSFQQCRQLLLDNNIELQKLSKIFLFGGTCKIPYIEENLLQYAQMEIDERVQLYNYASLPSDLVADGAILALM